MARSQPAPNTPELAQPGLSRSNGGHPQREGTITGVFVPIPAGLQKGPAERGHVKKRQKSSKSVKKFFDTFRQFSRRAKNVKKSSKSQKYFRHFSTIFARHLFSGPFCNPLTIWLVLPRCEATTLGVFDTCHFALLKRGCANSGGFGAR